MRLAGKSAIVTGAGRGIGKATALRFAREGADVLVPDLDRETSQQTAKEIQALGRKGVPMQMDVTRMADIRRMDYCASKFAVIGMTQSLALALAKHGIRVNAVAPGIVDTDMWDQIDREWSALEGKPAGEMKRTRVGAIPLGRIETPEDVANLYAFLASDDAGYITGQTYNVCGGLQLN